MQRYVEKKEMDAEWIQLIKEAKTIGITREEIRVFLLTSKKQKTK
ncbi:anti-repressor SinI family protein [Lentibacillus sp. N15]